MNAKTFYFSIASALTLGLAIAGNAQEMGKREISLKNMHRINAPKVKRPIDRVPFGTPIINLTVDAHAVLQNEPQPKALTYGYLYDNATVPSGYVYSVAGPALQEGWCDDVELSAGQTSGGTAPAKLSAFRLPAWNKDTVAAHTMYCQIAIYDDWDLSQVPSLVGAPLAVYHITSTNPLAASSIAYYLVGSQTAPLGISLPHDLSQVLDGTHGGDYGFVLDYADDSTFTTYSANNTVFFNLDGVALGDSVGYWALDDNNDQDFDANELYVFTGFDANNFYTRWYGDSVNNATTEFTTTITYTGLAVTAGPQKVTIDLVPTLAGVPTGGTPITVSGTFTVAEDPNNPGVAISNVTVYGIPQSEYHIRVKGGSFLSAYVTDDPTQPYDPTNPTANPITAVNLLRNQYGIPATLFLSGDATGDDVVNGADFGALVNAYGAISPDPLYDATVDFNGDGTVDIADFSTLASDYTLSGNPLGL